MTKIDGKTPKGLSAPVKANVARGVPLHKAIAIGPRIKGTVKV